MSMRPPPISTRAMSAFCMASKPVNGNVVVGGVRTNFVPSTVVNGTMTRLEGLSGVSLEWIDPMLTISVGIVPSELGPLTVTANTICTLSPGCMVPTSHVTTLDESTNVAVHGLAQDAEASLYVVA